ncbi:MAG: choice-of-anchor D domain-containing protein [Candidatus Binataceae bacterium]
MGRKLDSLKFMILLGTFAASVAAGSLPTAAQTQSFMPDRQVVQRLLFPIAASSFPVAAGDTIADHVLGQMDFVHATQNFAYASTLDLQRSLAGVAIDLSSVPNHVYVADTSNSRVLGWASAAALTNGKPADIVIGQPDFFSTTCNNGGVSASSLCGPFGVAVDGSGNLYVSDYGNNRVLEYNTPFTNTGEPGSGDKIADQVFGQQGSFGSSLCNQGAGTLANSGTLCRPSGVAIDATGVLYIADGGNNRVLEYLFPSVDVIANDLFGQKGQFSTVACNKGGIGPDSLCSPAGLATDNSNNLYIADSGNSRVLEYDDPPANDTTADRVFGQENNFTSGTCNVGLSASALTLCGPGGVALDAAGHLYIADRGNSRVLEYPSPMANTIPFKVFGQKGSMSTTTCNISGAPDANGLCRPAGVALDAAGNLYVSDNENNRALKYNSAFAGDTTADVVLGQPDFAHNNRNKVDASGFAGGAGDVILAGTLDISALGAVAIDNSVSPPRLWVADTHNNRVLAFNNVDSLVNGAPAAIVVGQPDFSEGSACSIGGPTASNLCSPTGVTVDAMGNLYVADEENNRVLKYAAPVTTAKAASLVIGQADFTSNKCNSGLANPTAATLCSPWTIALDGAGNLYVADLTNNRVLEYAKPLTSHPNAAHVFGQPGFTTYHCNQGGSVNSSGLCGPTGVTVDSSGRLFIADFNNSRVLRYNGPLTSSVANLVFGQASNFTTSACNGGGVGAATLCNPAGVATDNGNNVYIADSGNNRILHYVAGSVTADVVFGQGGFFITNKADLGGTTPSAATLALPLWLAVDGSDNLYASDAGNNRVLQYLAPLGGPSPTPTPGLINVSPGSLNFGNVATGNVSPVKKVTLTNTGAGSITINAVNRVGSNPTDFPQNNNCVGTLGAGKSCTISVMFAPSAATGTPEAAQFNIYDNGKNAPQLLPVYGTSAPGATLAPASLVFGNVAVAATSVAKNLTLTNNRSAALTISSIALSGTNPGDFLKTTTCGASLAAFASCTIPVQFKPTALGSRSATVVVTDSANNSPQSTTLQGTGSAPASVIPSSLAFGNVTKGTTSAAKTVTVTNNLSATLTVSSISLSGSNPGDFLKSTTCGASLAAFGSCTVSVSFKPTATGARSATLAIADSPDSGSPHNVALTGTGQ